MSIHNYILFILFAKHIHAKKLGWSSDIDIIRTKMVVNN